MPNHIKNRLTLTGSIEDIDSLLKRYSTYHAAKVDLTHDNDLIICRDKLVKFNFCWFDPKTGRSKNRGDLDQAGIPNNFEIEISDSYTEFPDFSKVIPPPKHDPAYNDEPSQEAVRDDPNWWYNWNTENWGTKWDAYSCEKEAINIYTFETAWDAPHKIITEIARQFPEVNIVHYWADEDTGYNCGKNVYQGVLIENFQPHGGSKEAYDIAFNLRPDRKEDYEIIDGNYEVR